MSIDALRDTFFEEAEELIDALVDGLEAMASDAWDNETVNAIFRSVHSIKGAAGAFGLEKLVTFSHCYETVLDRIRSDELSVDEPVLHVITRASDVLAELLDLARSGEDDAPAAMAGLLGELEKYSADSSASTGKATPASISEPEDEFSFEPLQILSVEDNARTEVTTVVSFKPKPSLYSNGHEPGTIIAAIESLGAVVTTCDTSQVPQLSEYEHDASYLSWCFEAQPDVDVAMVRSKFQFVETLSEVSVQSKEADTIGLPILLDVDLAQPAEKLEKDTTKSDPIHLDAPQGEDSVLAKTKAPKSADPAAKKSAPQKNKKPVGVSSTIRVDPERVDRLINTVSELIINQAVIGQKLIGCEQTHDAELMSALDEYRELAREIQEGVMSIRAQPIKSLFQRMGRVVREAADATGKNVTFVTEGESTEIDKTLLERLADPLTHMLRNAVDHGIEDPQTRGGTNKAPKGTVRLTAAHKSGNVLIEVVDDGAGLDPEKIKHKATKKGLIPADANLTEAETFGLLFAAGFSTAENVTNLSGRGVGMDVVKTSITALGGKVNIISELGKGSTFTIQMPLTLAVMDGMIVTLGDDVMVVPLASVVETVRPTANEIIQVDRGEMMLSVRGDCVPIVDLAKLFGMNSRFKSEGKPHILVNSDNGSKIALAVDSITDQRQVVIKSLEGNYVSVPGIAAATILGDGKIALIVDTNALMQLSIDRLTQQESIKMEA